MGKTLLTFVMVVTSCFQLLAQDQPILATIEQGFHERARIIGNAGSSLVYHDNGNIYLSDGTVNGTNIIGTLQEDEKIKHAQASLGDKLYFVIGKTVGASDDVEVLVEVDPVLAIMRSLVTSQDEITGLVDYRQRLYFALTDHPSFGHAYVSYQPANGEYEFMFDAKGFGVQDAVNHAGLIYLILQSPLWDGVSLAASDGNTGSLEEIFNLGDDDAYGWDVTINMTSADSKLYFWHEGNNSGFTLFVTDGTQNGTLELLDELRRNHWENNETHELQDIITIGDRIFFGGADGFITTPGLWTSDGTPLGTLELFLSGDRIVSPHDFTVLNQELYVGVRSAEAVVVDLQSLAVDYAFRLDEPGNEVLAAGNDMVNHNGTLYLSAWSILDREFEIYTKNSQNNMIRKVTGMNLGVAPIISSITSVNQNLFFFVIGSDPSTFRIFDANTSNTQELANQKFEVYPNPSQSTLYLDGVSQGEEVIILNSVGNIVRRLIIDGDTSLSISDLSSGVYYVKYANHNSAYPASFIKN